MRKLTIIQAACFLLACILAFVFYSWKLIPILILFGWSNNMGIIKSLAEAAKKEKEKMNNE